MMSASDQRHAEGPIRLPHPIRHRLRAVSTFVGMAALYVVGLAALAILAAVIHSPPARYAPETSWAELHLVQSLGITAPLAGIAVLGMLVSVVVDKIAGNRADLRFYPLRNRMRSLLRSVPARSVLVGGVLIIVGYLTVTFTVPSVLGPIAKGWFWPAERILMCLVLAWITIWLAETVVRPVRTPLVAAILLGAASLVVGCSPTVRPSITTEPTIGSDLPIRGLTDLIHLVGYKIESKPLQCVPPWATETIKTEHFVYHYGPGDEPLLASLEAQERHYEFCKSVLCIDMPQQIHFVKYTPERFADSFAPGCGGIGAGGYVHSRFWFHPHEALHNYLRSRKLFLHEGIAEAFGTSFYYFWGDVCDKDFETSIPALYEGMDRVLGVSQDDRVVASNFVRWLFHRYGPKKLVTVLREAYLEGSRTRDVIARVCGMPFGDVAAQWQRDQKWLSEQQPPEGFFVYPPWDKEVEPSRTGAFLGGR